jgi:UDP-3-O-[3-hydroxymyristoyl] glucosamine N-acyltransferase
MSAFFRPLPHAVTAAELARRVALPATLAGHAAAPIRGIAPLGPGHVDALSFADPQAAAERIAASLSSVIIVAPREDLGPADGRTLIVTEDPRSWFIAAVEALLPETAREAEPQPGVDPRARIHPDARIAASAAIGDDVEIGAHTRVGPGAVVCAGTRIGAHCIIGPGTVIGWVGLAYHDDRHGTRRYFPHLAGVRIADWVDIGANCCVCRGILSDTTIGNDVKIGSLVYIGHGAVVGDRVWISASTSLAGHSRAQADALVGIGTTVIDNVAIASGALVGAGSLVTRTTEPGGKVAGVPARSIPTLRRFGPTPR